MAKHAQELTIAEENENEFMLNILSLGLDVYLKNTKSDVEQFETGTSEETDKHAGYDWNVFVPDYNTLTLSAYPWITNPDGSIHMDSSGWVSLEITMSEDNADIIAYLLEEPNWASQGWVDHDDWLDEEYLSAEDAPGIVRYFVRQIKKMTKAEFAREARKNK